MKRLPYLAAALVLLAACSSSEDDNVASPGPTADAGPGEASQPDGTADAGAEDATTDAPQADRSVPDASADDAPGDGVTPADLSGPDLGSPDLPGPDLPGPDLPGPDLPGPDLPGPDLPGPDLGSPDLGASPGPVTLVDALPLLGAFARPVDIQHPPDGSDRLFIVEQRGKIWVVDNDPSTTSATEVLDLTALVRSYTTGGNEQGLLGLAFHPSFASNGQFFVNYTNQLGDTVVARYTIDPQDPSKALPGSALVVLEETQTASNHNGGQLAFAADGSLFISFGDGGDDPTDAQDLGSLLGTIVRIDVDSPAAGKPYGIPADNPFVGTSGARAEIWAYGLRNPWRFSFDPVTGWLWAGDVGQDKWEEVDVIDKGKNYGWPVMEGKHCHSPPTGCNQAGLELPIVEYSHAVGVSITGGFVYRGKALPQLVGWYVYADWLDGQVWALKHDGVNPTQNVLLLSNSKSIAGFGVDAGGELYAAAFDGRVYRFE